MQLPAHSEPSDTAILLAQPSPEALEELTVEQMLSKYWRLLFHAKVHQTLDQAVGERRLTAAGVAQRIARLGIIEFQEIRSVLRQEDLLVPPKSDLVTYVEFAAVYLELRYFAESFLPAYFADIRDFARVDDVLREDLDAEWIFQATRPVGAPDTPWRGDLAGEREASELELAGGKLAPLGRLRRPSPYRFRAPVAPGGQCRGGG